ncbi:MAG: hypothetical protein IPH13_06100 [Planctomycetes bacterium]|nr:hypothetical protein [Planctomycetota bacterium]MCC7169042.1 hypothetical protein [Planctomycetota bacterium]
MANETRNVTGWKWSASVLLAAALSACASEPNPLDAPGIEWSEDEVFRYRDFPGHAADEVFRIARGVLRLRFAGGSMIEDAAAGKLQTSPRGFSRMNRRVTMYAQISAIDGGARVEVFAPIEEMLDDPREDPENPWRTIGRDGLLENVILEDVYAAIETRR